MNFRFKRLKVNHKVSEYFNEGTAHFVPRSKQNEQQ
jgi:hypothetical protein